ncbi:MAG: HPr family phosphocarrier protein [Lachnospiraceae bacterium]
MISRDIQVKIKSGLETRPVALLVQVASQYDSKIYVENNSGKFNAKSIMGMMTLGLCEGDNIKVTAEGEDEEKAVADIEEYLSGRK